MDIWHFRNDEEDMRELLNKIEEMYNDTENEEKILNLYYIPCMNEWEMLTGREN